MHFAVMFNDTGTESVMIFSCASLEDALRFTQDRNHFIHPERVTFPIAFSGEIRDLYALFPRREKE